MHCQVYASFLSHELHNAITQSEVLRLTEQFYGELLNQDRLAGSEDEQDPSSVLVSTIVGVVSE